MPLLIAAPEMVNAAASDLANLGSTIETAVATAAAPTTQVVAPAGDEVSAAIATLFGGHGQWYQTLGARAAAFHDQFVRALSGAAASYTAAEAANVSPLQTVERDVLGVMTAPTQTLLGQPLIGAGAGGGNTATVAGTAAGLIGTGEARAVAAISAATSPLALQQGLTNIAGSVQTGVANLTGSVSAAGLNLTGVPGPISQWANVFTGAWTNLQQIGAEMQADPLPILAQVVHNQLGFASRAGSDLALIWSGGLQPLLQQMPQNLQTLFSSFAAGNFSSAVNTFNSGILVSLIPTAGSLVDLLQIPGAISQNFTNVLSQQLPTIGLDLLLAPLGISFGTSQAMADTMQSAVDAWSAGQPLVALADVANLPAAATGAFLNGYQSSFDIGYTGLLSSAESPFGGGLLDTMLVQIPQSVATTLAGGSPPATWTDNYNDFMAMLNSGLSTVF